MEDMFLPLRRYADFSGRSRRREYWMFQLFIWGCLLVMFGVFAAVGGGLGGSGGGAIAAVMLGIMGLFFLGLFIPALAVTVRRFHDQDKSGWFILLNFIPYVGGIVVFVFMCIEGTKGQNRFGQDPKYSAQDVGDVFA
jgi:uncharacterized membrane protein YhaH (DUF805 family)